MGDDFMKAMAGAMEALTGSVSNAAETLKSTMGDGNTFLEIPIKADPSLPRNSVRFEGNAYVIGVDAFKELEASISQSGHVSMSAHYEPPFESPGRSLEDIRAWLRNR